MSQSGKFEKKHHLEPDIFKCKLDDHRERDRQKEKGTTLFLEETPQEVDHLKKGFMMSR